MSHKFLSNISLESHVRDSDIFLDGYCSTVQGLLDWFEVDLGFTELLFIQISLCVVCVFTATSLRLSVLKFLKRQPLKSQGSNISLSNVRIS